MSGPSRYSRRLEITNPPVRILAPAELLISIEARTPEPTGEPAEARVQDRLPEARARESSAVRAVARRTSAQSAETRTPQQPAAPAVPAAAPAAATSAATSAAPGRASAVETAEPRDPESVVFIARRDAPAESQTAPAKVRGHERREPGTGTRYIRLNDEDEIRVTVPDRQHTQGRDREKNLSEIRQKTTSNPQRKKGPTGIARTREGSVFLYPPPPTPRTRPPPEGGASGIPTIPPVIPTRAPVINVGSSLHGIEIENKLTLWQKAPTRDDCANHIERMELMVQEQVKKRINTALQGLLNSQE